MKILAVGDPHGYENIKNIKVDEDIDLILITGDLAEASSIRKLNLSENRKEKPKKQALNQIYVRMMNSAYSVLTHFEKSKKPVLFVYGNVFGMDLCYIKGDTPKHKLEFFKEKIKKMEYTRNIGLKKTRVKNKTIMGVPFYKEMEWINKFKGRSGIELAKIQQPKIRKFLSKMGYVDIVLSHIPPYGVLDKVNNSTVPKNWIGKHAGSRDLLKYIKKHHPKYVICGHIHEAEGIKNIGNTKVINLGEAKTKIIEL